MRITEKAATASSLQFATELSLTLFSSLLSFQIIIHRALSFNRWFSSLLSIRRLRSVFWSITKERVSLSVSEIYLLNHFKIYSNYKLQLNSSF